VAKRDLGQPVRVVGLVICRKADVHPKLDGHGRNIAFNEPIGVNRRAAARLTAREGSFPRRGESSPQSLAYDAT
jgi:hypothetical protein